jgi:hypothetical protein
LQISQGYIIRILQHFATKLWNIANFVMLFHAMMEFCLDLLRSKFWLIGEWSIHEENTKEITAMSVVLFPCWQRSLFPSTNRDLCQQGVVLCEIKNHVHLDNV